jgi:23S rRNA pseudouridine955/2504/2580 synthase
MKAKAIDIIFENDDFVALNKASGVLTIPDRHDEMQPSLYKYLRQQYENIFIVHRLDRDTSGLILFAKNAKTHKYLSQLFEQRKIEKTYQGIIHGSLPIKKGSINEPITEHPYQKGMMTVTKKGNLSITDYEVLEDYGIFSLVQFKIHTGRTHQIRVHMKYEGHPIICDPLYGDGRSVLLSSFRKKYKLSQHDEEERPIISRLALHSLKLELPDADGKPHSIKAPLPKDMKALLQQLKKTRKQS